MKCFMDDYIEENFEAVSVCNEFLSLPRIKVGYYMNVQSFGLNSCQILTWCNFHLFR